MTEPPPDTPFAVVEREQLERNLQAVQRYCDAHGLALRPHVKTHKTREVLELQLALGARGVACQKLGEAERLGRPGLDTLITFSLVGERRLERLAALSAGAPVSVTVDDVRMAQAMSAALRRRGRSVGVWIDCDTGLGRTGVRSSSAALSLATAVAALPGLELRGLLAYPLPPPGSWLEQAIVDWVDAGLPGPEVSVGATPTAYATHERGYATELRVGTYAFNDLECVQAGAATLAECALAVRATCVARPARDRAVVDAGSKALGLETVDVGGDHAFGVLRERPDVAVRAVYEEHGILTAPAHADLPELGDQIDIVPAHCCFTVNLHDTLWIESKGALAPWRVAARGAFS